MKKSDSIPRTLRVGSYNIRTEWGDGGTPNAWEERRGDLLALLRSLGLDVFGLQEVTPCQHAWLRERLGAYAFLGDFRGADRATDEASPVCYRRDRFDLIGAGTFWLSDTPDAPGSRGPGAACPRVCTHALLRDRASGAVFCFANTHTDHVSEEARTRGLEILQERLRAFAPGSPVLLTGDMNCSELEGSVRSLEPWLRDAFVATEAPPAGPWRTFHAWQWTDREVTSAVARRRRPEDRNELGGGAAGVAFEKKCRGRRIDFIYASPSVRVLRYAVHGDARPGLERYPSDHFPVVAAVELPASCVGPAAPLRVPELLRTEAGDRVETVEAWEKIRKPEIAAFFRDNVYGRRPIERPASLSFEKIGADKTMMGGAAVRKRVRIRFAGPCGEGSFTCLAFIPTAARRAPAPSFLFVCNRDPAEHLDPERKKRSGFWPAEEIVRRGYAAIAFHNGDVTPDSDNGRRLGAFAAFADVDAAWREPDGWGVLSCWAWGASRVLDWIETEPLLDARRVAVIGHSRGGKTALLAAATDPRFAMACSNEAGQSGDKLNHIPIPGSETIALILRQFPFWFCRNYALWANRDLEMPYDQHELLALLAPRPVCIGSATGDPWSGPLAEYWTARLASPAWELYGKKGLVSDAFPRPGRPQQRGAVSYHLRTGPHDLTPYDWGVYMDFADKRLRP